MDKSMDIELKAGGVPGPPTHLVHVPNNWIPFKGDI